MHEVACPYCGTMATGLWEISENDFERQCHNCNKTFRIKREVFALYEAECEGQDENPKMEPVREKSLSD